jgi:hypothetical protein
VESWDGIYSIEAGSGTRINCLNFLAYEVLTTHTGIAGQRANGITDVPDQVINDIHVAHIATLLLALFDAAHRAGAARRASSRVRPAAIS